MELRFDANQDFQLQAIDSIADLFDGQPLTEVALEFSLSAGGAMVVLNRLDLGDEVLLENLQRVQARSELAEDSTLQYIDQVLDTPSGELRVRFPNFSVEMETGTGKTYVYLRTILELYKRYGFRKYVVVVPSVAIREGVLKTLNLTEHHLKELYANVPYRYYAYAAENLNRIRQFALSNGVEVMVMTIDSFNKPTNVLWQSDTDRLQGETPIHLVQAARPILILDEPQNMEGEARVRALGSLNPLFALRYSATHRNPYNNAYRLTPFEAYRQGLVKRIEVASVLKEGDVGQPFARLESIKATKRTVSAKLAVHKLMKTGVVKEKTVTVKIADSIEAKTDRPEYADYMVEEINPGGEFIRFSNGLEISIGDATGTDKDALFDAQIRYTIEEHFRKQARLRDRGLKVLSLFFIDRVDRYTAPDGFIRATFEKQFNDLKLAHEEWRDIDVSTIHAGYFSQQRRRSGAIEFVESSGGEEDRTAYNLIMKDKERLLSFEEPVSFIFSHSALREGWDSPNVFQICTLNQTASEVKKRQEVGRGMRLPVDQTGDRIHDLKSDALTVVANESYQQYISTLQQEIEDDYGVAGKPPPPGDARKRGIAQLRKRRLLKPEFKELWERIRQKTRYAMQVDTEALIADVVPRIDAIQIRPPRVTITKAQVAVDTTEDALEALQLSAAKTVSSLVGRYPVPSVVDLMSHLMEHTSPSMYLTRRTLLEIFRRSESKEAGLENPHDFATASIKMIKQRLADHLVDGIKYTKVDEWYEMTEIEAQIDSWERYLVSAPHSIYDHIIFESDIERKFVEGLEKRKDVLLYWKLPAWFKVPTPVGDYNPDWAIVLEDRDEHGRPTGKPCLYLVRETKSTHKLDKLRPDERRKVLCGERHFEGALTVDYAVATDASELP